MDFMNGTSIWILAGLIFLIRILDVSLGTMRTIAVVQGRVAWAVALAFVEVLLWVFAVSQVIMNLRSHPYLAIAFAGGFATGNAVGIALERRLAIGTTALRIVSSAGDAIAAAIARDGNVVATIEGTGPAGPTVLVYATCKRRRLNAILQTAQAIDPKLFFVIERFAETSKLVPLPQPTGWRAVLKKK